jgi:hypothetical protein
MAKRNALLMSLGSVFLLSATGALVAEPLLAGETVANTLNRVDANCQSTVPSEGRQVVDFFDFMTQALSSSPSPKPCGEETREFSRLPDPPPGTLGPCSNIAAFCESVTEYVNKRTGNSAAFWGLTSSGKCGAPGQVFFSDQAMLGLRSENFDYAGRELPRIVHDPAIQTQCCGDDSRCSKRFANIRMLLITGVGDEDVYAEDGQHEPYNVEVTLGRVANCRSQDCIDFVFYHELGHACHSLQHYQKNQDAEFWANATLKDMDRYLGSDGVACVKAALRSGGAGSLDEKDIPGAYWAEEAYANVVFAGRQGIAGIATLCASPADKYHSRPRDYLGCLLKTPELQSRYCTPPR